MKNTKKENSSIRKTKQNRLMLFPSCVVCGKKKLIFIKNYKLQNFNNIWNDYFEVNKIINKFLMTGDKFMPEFYLKQPGFTYSSYGPLTKHREKNKKWEKQLI